MAVNIGPKIGIDGEKEFRSALNNIIQQSKTLDSEMRAVAASFSSSATAQEKYADTSKILGERIKVQEELVAELAKALEAASKEFGENNTKTLKWKQALNDATADLNKLQREAKEGAEATDDLGDAFDKAEKEASTFGDVLKANILSDVVISGFRAMADAVKKFGEFALESGMNFESQMSRVEAIAGANAAQMEALEAKAKEMGKSTIFSASESAQALEYMAMAGWKTEDMLDGLEGIMNLAAASGEELATVSDIVTDALTAFGLQAEDSEHFADVLAVASNSANTNVSMMGETFKYVAPVAGALGYSIEDVAVATGLLANAGIKGEQAGTALRGILSKLAKPTARTKEYIEKMGVTLSDASGNVKPLSELLEELRVKFAGLTEAQQAEYAAGIAGTEGMSAMLTLVNTSKADFDALTQSIARADGTAEKMAETMTDNLGGSITLLKSAAEGLAISLYQTTSGVMKDIVDQTTELLSGNISVEGFINRISQTIPEILKTGGDMIQALLTGMIQAIPALGASLTPVVTQLAEMLIQNAPLIFSAGGAFLLAIVNGMGQSLPTLIPAAVDAVLTIVDGLIDNIDLVVEAGIALLVGLTDGLMDALPKLIGKMPELINKLSVAIIESLPVIVQTGVEIILSIITGLLKSIPELLKNAKEIATGIGDEIRKVNWGQLGIDIILGIANGIANKASDLVKAAKDAVSGALEAAKDFLGISSPSKVFADEVGRMIPEGITLGIDKTVPALIRDARAQLGELVNASIPQMDAPIANNYGGLNIVVHVDGAATEDTGRVIGQQIARELRYKGVFSYAK